MSHTKKTRPKRKVDPQIQQKINLEKARKEQLEKAKRNVVIFPTENQFQPRSTPFNKTVKARNVPMEIRNSYANYDRIMAEFAQGRAQCVGTRHGKHGGPCLIIGSGPSLDDALPVIEKWEGGIICSPSHASSLVKWGRPPDYVLALDYRSEFHHGMLVDNWRKYPTSLILHPCMNSNIVRDWRWSKFYYRTLKPEEEFYDETLRIAYPQIKIHMLVFSCAIPGQIGMANLLGYDPIFLVGCDFSIYRFRKWEYRWKELPQRKGLLGKIAPRRIPFTGHWIQAPKPGLDVANLIQADNGQWTNRIQLFYKRSLFMGLRLDRLQTFAVKSASSEKSIVTEFPEVSLDDLMASGGWGFEELYRKPEEMIRELDLYLCGQEAFPIPMRRKGQPEDDSHDIHYFEVDDPENHVPPVVHKYAETFGLALDPEEYSEYLLDLHSEFREKRRKMRAEHGLDPEGRPEQRVSSPLRTGGNDGPPDDK